MPILNDKEYRCDMCNEIFGLIRDEEWNDNIVEEEYKRLFPSASMKNREIICDDCWQIVRPDAKSS